jgi:hypothetical protein
MKVATTKAVVTTHTQTMKATEARGEVKIMSGWTKQQWIGPGLNPIRWVLRRDPLFYRDCEKEMRRRPLCLIGIVLDDAASTLTCEPVPNLRHLFQLLFQLEVRRLNRLLTALGGILLVFRDLLHGPTGPNHRKNSTATMGR